MFRENTRTVRDDQCLWMICTSSLLTVKVALLVGSSVLSAESPLSATPASLYKQGNGGQFSMWINSTKFVLTTIIIIIIIIIICNGTLVYLGSSERNSYKQSDTVVTHTTRTFIHVPITANVFYVFTLSELTMHLLYVSRHQSDLFVCR